MNQSTFTNLTGVCLDEGQLDRFEMMSALATSQLEELLGWPLDPGSFDNQYEESGKADEGHCSCSAVDVQDLEEADPVVGSYRLFRWNPSDRVLLIDPATAIHAVKLVSNDITFKTFDEEEYIAQWVNGSTKYTKSLKLCNYGYYCGCREITEGTHMLAVDADWAFEMDEENLGIPLELQKVLADLINTSMDDNDNIKSETILSHSYTKFEKENPLVKHSKVIQKYAGPNGTIKRPRIV